MTADVGSYTTVFAAAAKEVVADKAKWKGAYMQPIARFGKSSKMATSEELAKELWETTERILAQVASGQLS